MELNAQDIIDSLAVTIANQQVAIAERDAVIKLLQRELAERGEPETA